MTGIVIIDKPAGWTSHDVVAKLRGLLGERRIGHAGTLDPMATGVLPVFVGRATRAVEFASESDKEYIAGLQLGRSTDTQDITGTVLERRTVGVDRGEVASALDAFRGEIAQIPPMYSAIKVQGKKLYDLARRGVEVERAPRPVTIYELELLDEQASRAADSYLLRVVCSKGTYVRTLCHDLGGHLGCGGTLCSLRRTRAAGFGLDRAVTLEQVAEAAARGEAEGLLLPLDAYFGDLTAWQTDGAGEKRIRDGGDVPCDCGPGRYRVYGPGGTFLMVGQADRGRMTTVKSFFSV